MPKKKRKKSSAFHAAAVKAFTLVFLLVAAFVATLFWASQSEHSELARSIRQIIGLPEPATQPTEASRKVSVPPEPEVLKQAPPPPPPEPTIEPTPIPEITLREIVQSRSLWPRTLNLTVSRNMPIRYNGNQYGFLEFTPDSRLEVVSLDSSGEVVGTINGNPLTISLQNTNFVEWFETNYGERFTLLPIPEVEAIEDSNTLPPLGTAEGDTAFWTEMRIWCKQNYDSVSIEAEEDTLVFRWSQQHDVATNYAAEARNVAEKYLKLRIEYGSDENYAACEIRDPETNELLGASSVFMPQL